MDSLDSVSFAWVVSIRTRFYRSNNVLSHFVVVLSALRYISSSLLPILAFENAAFPPSILYCPILFAASTAEPMLLSGNFDGISLSSVPVIELHSVKILEADTYLHIF